MINDPYVQGIAHASGVWAVVLFLFWAVTSNTLASAVAAAREAVELLAEWTEAARDREGR